MRPAGLEDARGWWGPGAPGSPRGQKGGDASSEQGEPMKGQAHARDCDLTAGPGGPLQDAPASSFRSPHGRRLAEAPGGPQTRVLLQMRKRARGPAAASPAWVGSEEGPFSSRPWVPGPMSPAAPVWGWGWCGRLQRIWVRRPRPQTQSRGLPGWNQHSLSPSQVVRAGPQTAPPPGAVAWTRAAGPKWALEEGRSPGQTPGGDQGTPAPTPPRRPPGLTLCPSQTKGSTPSSWEVFLGDTAGRPVGISAAQRRLGPPAATSSGTGGPAGGGRT